LVAIAHEKMVGEISLEDPQFLLTVPQKKGSRPFLFNILLGLLLFLILFDLFFNRILLSLRRRTGGWTG
jgi:hypothetical protein